MKRLLALAAAMWMLGGAFVTVADAGPRCPVGHSQMGCSLPPVLKGITPPPKGEIIPDVSSYQRTVDWPAVKAWQLSHGWKVTGGIFKLGENVLDPYALQNASGLHAADMAAVGYVFVRPGVEASTIISWAKQAGIKVVVLDEEIAGIQGTSARVTPALKAAGLTVVDYHSLSNIYDTTADGEPCWVAAYGLPPSPRPVCTTGATKGWQFTDLGSVPGITGLADESVSYGLLKLAAPAPPRTICFGKGAQASSKCAVVVERYRWLISRRDFWRGEFGRCIRYADGIKCEHAQYWEIVRGQQAVTLRKRYSR